jgi:hypothetical protein
MITISDIHAILLFIIISELPKIVHKTIPRMIVVGNLEETINDESIINKNINIDI